MRALLLAGRMNFRLRPIINTTLWLRPLAKTTTGDTKASSSDTSTPQSIKRRPLRECWECGSAIPSSAIFCPRLPCTIVQPYTGDQQDFFDVFEHPPSFRIDEKELRTRFLKLQHKCHPDSWTPVSSKDPTTERMYAESQAAFINKAYHTLRDPLARANYLLHRLGSPVGEEDTVLHEGANHQILLEIMELREEIDEAQSGEHVEQIRQRADSMKHTVLSELDAVFDELISANPTGDYINEAGSVKSQITETSEQRKNKQQHLKNRAKHLSVKLKYLYGVEKACREWYFSQ